MGVGLGEAPWDGPNRAGSLLSWVPGGTQLPEPETAPTHWVKWQVLHTKKH